MGRKKSHYVPPPPPPFDTFLTGLPSDLVPLLMKTSDCPTITYMQLLGLSHGIRLAIRGAARELAFEKKYDERAPIPLVPLEALTALIRPCKKLANLSLINQQIGVFAYGSVTACAAWIDEAFAGHQPLAQLRAPMCPFVMAFLSRQHSSDLEELRLDGGTTSVTTALLTALGESCPRLRTLHLPKSVRARFELTALGPLKHTLEEICFPSNVVVTHLQNVVPKLKVLSLLRPTADFSAVVPHLTHLTLWESAGTERFDFHPQLESLVMRRCPSVNLSRVLKPNHSLRVLVLHQCLDEVQLRTDVLPALGQITRLEFSARASFLLPLRLASSHLRSLDLKRLILSAQSSLTLDCPGLEELVLPTFENAQAPYALSLIGCPRLRRLVGPQIGEDPVPAVTAWEEALLPQFGPSLHELTEIWTAHLAPLETLRLRTHHLTLLGVHLVGPGLFSRSDSAYLRVPPTSTCFLDHLPLSDHLHRLDATLHQVDDRMVVDAAGLRVACLSSGDGATEEIWPTFRGCPALSVLYLHAPKVHLHIEDGSRLPPLQLRSLAIDGCRQGLDVSVTSCLEHRGACLRQLRLPYPTPETWPRLVAALTALPQLTSLELVLGDTADQADIGLACPHLRRLTLEAPRSVAGRLGRVILDCPRLEELLVLCDIDRLDVVARDRQTMLYIGASNADIQRRLAARFLGARVEQAARPW
ncbi:hypothetical protein PAPYR_9241 [Paratrimastix pyriformis]|uniref:Uncharacterized protein n=1 Tax=Paratrimastix pyriformis TaxID=342808 RepID=A0ABQ8UDL8_9EUKA|nr:hypothetical protein PAPYR_9241 [Paratrimastix pyriformis]